MDVISAKISLMSATLPDGQPARYPGARRLRCSTRHTCREPDHFQELSGRNEGGADGDDGSAGGVAASRQSASEDPDGEGMDVEAVHATMTSTT